MQQTCSATVAVTQLHSRHNAVAQDAPGHFVSRCVMHASVRLGALNQGILCLCKPRGFPTVVHPMFGGRMLGCFGRASAAARVLKRST